MRSCLTGFLAAAVILGVSLGVGYLVVNQLQIGYCQDQPLRIVASLVLALLVFLALLAVLFSLFNFEILEKGLSGGQIAVMALLTSMVGLGLVTFFTYRSAQAACPRLVLEADLTGICNGSSLAQAGAYDPLTSDASYLVVLGSDGRTIPWTAEAQTYWNPVDLGDIDLVACVSPAVDEVVETCQYLGVIDVNRTRQQVAVRLVSPADGREIAATTLSSEPAPCQPMGIQNLGTLRGDLAYSDLQSWSARALEQVVPPTPTAVPTPELIPTPQPTAITATLPPPSPTPGIQGTVVTGARLRSGPGTDFAVLDGLYTGDILIVLAANPERTWLKVQSPRGQIGWIFADLVELAGGREMVPLAP